MITAVYIIGVTITVLVLAVRLRETRHQLRQVTRQRNTCVRAIESWLDPIPPADPAAMPASDGPGHPGLAQQPGLWPRQHEPGPSANGTDRRPGA